MAVTLKLNTGKIPQLFPRSTAKTGIFVLIDALREWKP